ncbi:hypothetical protein ACIBG6_17525 [Streptomyces sp. NPDC050842]|uniref:hypothetical protein n=1 Tax=Streptomyces sp. NPDC050842 TaxID=3365636 RepID=UPI0037AAE010
MRRRKPGLVAVALCLGGALTACGGGDDEGYAAVGAGPSPRGAVAPSGAVTLVPLDSPTASGTTSSTSSPAPAPSSPSSPSPPPLALSPSSPPSSSDAAGGNTAPSAGPGTSGTSGTSGGSGSSGTESGTAPVTSAPATSGSSSAAPGTGGGTPPRTPSSAPGTGPSTAPPTTPGRPSPSPTAPPAPALLTVSAPTLADADRRWCEQVTVTFRNTGGTAARSGTVTFATHVIGALGVDWATVASSQALPAPIAAGTARTQTYRVCVDSWRVPLGMRIDTRQVTVSWQ